LPSPDSYSAPAADSCSTDEWLPPVTNTEPPCSKVRTGVATASSTDDSHVLPSHSKVHRQLVFVACQRRLCDQLRPQDQRATIPHVMRPLEETLTSTTSPAVSSVMKTSHGPSAVANARAYAPPTSYVKFSRARTWPTGRKLPPPPPPGASSSRHRRLPSGTERRAQEEPHPHPNGRRRDVKQRCPCIAVARRHLTSQSPAPIILTTDASPQPTPRVASAASYEFPRRDLGRHRRPKTRATCCMTRLRKKTRTGAHGMRHPQAKPTTATNKGEVSMRCRQQRTGGY